jgi:PTS system maltose and glucose-specific IIC component
MVKIFTNKRGSEKMMQIFSGASSGAWFEKAQRFGKSFMLPIAVLPAAGLLLGIGGALSNPNTLAAYPFLDVGWLQAIFTIMSSAGSIVFANLSVLFAVGVAVGLAKTDKGTAGLAALLAFLVMNATINALLVLTGELARENLGAVGQGMTLGIQTLETGVFGGVVIGLVTCVLHHRFNKIALPQFLGFFGGSRFVPIISSLAAILVGAVMTVIWPHFQKLIFGLGGLVEATGYLGTLLYGFILRMLGPFGLHHIFYLPFWTTALGGSEIVNGQLVEGTQRIFFAQLADPDTQQFYSGTSRFMSGRFITMMFGLLGACLAMYHTAKPENKKRVAGLLLSAALTSFLTGITEPIEFSFLFIAPVLYVIHALFDGLAFMLAHMLHITIGQTFSGGFIDFILFGILQGEAKTHWMYVPLVGVPWFFLYYFTFRFMINRFDFATPGREKESVVETTLPQSERAQAIIKGLGGKENLEEVDCCATRLRVTVKQGSKVNEAALKATGARGVILLTMAIFSATFATLIGSLTAVALYRYRFRGKPFVSGMLFVVMMSPDIVMAISLLVLFMLLGVQLGFWSLLFSHITFCLPFVVVTVYSRLKGFDVRMLEAAKDLGASEMIILRKIILPLAMPAVAAGWLLSFTLSMDDVVVSSFVTGPSYEILPLKIYSMVKVGVSPEVNALATILLILSLVLVIASQLIARDKTKVQGTLK